MSYLAVLDPSPATSAKATIDSHLNHSIVMCAKLLSTAAQMMAPEVTKINVGAGGKRLYVLNDMVLLPPLKTPQMKPWVDWISAEYQRAWWLVTLSWFLDKELAQRFGDGTPQHPMHLRMQEWVKAGLTKVFPKKGRKEWDFPLVLPPKAWVLVSNNPVDAYRHYYVGLQKTGTRMKWTGHAAPVWLDPRFVSAANACTECGATADDPRMCPVETCPGKKAYNL